MRTNHSQLENGHRAVLALGCLTVVAIWSVSTPAAAQNAPYPAMAPIGKYRMARDVEIVLAKSAAPASIADHAEVLVLGAHGYEAADKGDNGFVCLVARSWDNSFANAEFWNPKMRAPECFNSVAARSVLPRYLTRTEWVLAGVSKAEMSDREKTERATGKLKAPEPGAVCYMMSKGGYINDEAEGPWYPHVMFFVPRTEESQWGANLPASPVFADSVSYEQTTIFFVVVPKWSDGTPGPAHK